MDARDRLVVVPSHALCDLIGLVDRALVQLDSMQPHDPLQDCLRGAVAEVCVHSLLEPV